MENHVKADLALFAQDRWTLNRLTLNAGVRFEYWNGSVPAQHVPATRFLPERSYGPVNNAPALTDFNPRFGAAYDLFGDGRTALKLSLGRYVEASNIPTTALFNPFNTSVNTVDRTWNDTNGDFIPNCDLTNPVANGECGAFSAQDFGQPRIVTRFADDVVKGFGARSAMWDLSAEVQHQLRPGVSVSAGYFRNWASNFRANDNLVVTPADFDPFCITAPVDPRLPGGGGYQVCGLYDLTPQKFGLQDNLVSKASNFYDSGHRNVNCGAPGSFSSTGGAVVGSSGRFCGLSDFFNVSIEGRLNSGTLFGGGVDSGRTVLDNCFVTDSPQQLLYCRVTVPFHAQTQVKLYGSYLLPYDINVSAMFQNVGGPEIEA